MCKFLDYGPGADPLRVDTEAATGPWVEPNGIATGPWVDPGGVATGPWVDPHGVRLEARRASRLTASKRRA